MQSLGCFIDFVSKHSVTRPIQNSRELVVSHSASLAELPLYGNPLSYWASTNSCSEPFNRWGFTTVFDLSSVLDNTLALRHRIDSKELRGPRILTVGEPIWTVAPVYVRD